MSVMNAENPSSSRRTPISSTQLRAVKRVKFIHGQSGALTAVEFEMPPAAHWLHLVHEALSSRQVSITDSFTRLTEHALYQRVELSEPDGASLVGNRRREVEGLFLETLATIREH